MIQMSFDAKKLLSYWSCVMYDDQGKVLYTYAVKKTVQRENI